MTTHTWNDMRRLAVDAAEGRVTADQILDWIAAYTDGRVAAEHAKVEQQIERHVDDRLAAERERIAQAIEHRTPDDDGPGTYNRQWGSGLRSGMSRAAAIARRAEQ